MNLWLTVLLMIVVGLSAFATGSELIFRLFYALLGLIAVSNLWSRSNIRGLRVERKVLISRAQVGDVLEEEFRIEVSSSLPKLWVELEEASDLPGHRPGAVLSLAARGVKTWKAQTPLLQRGHFTLGPLEITSGDPFGLFRRSLKIPQEDHLLVFPATHELPHFQFPAGKLAGHGRVREPARTVTPSAAGTREYVHGDSFSRIHWLSTARKGKFMVKEFDQEPSNETWLLLDLDKSAQAGSGPQSTEEYMVTAAASIARRLLETGRAVGLAGYGSRKALSPPGKGTSQLLKILDALALITADGDANLRESIEAHSPRLGRNSGLIVFTAATDDDWISAVQHLAQNGVKPAAVILEPSTFGGDDNSLLVVSTLIASQIPSYLVRQGCNFSEAISSGGAR